MLNSTDSAEPSAFSSPSDSDVPSSANHPGPDPREATAVPLRILVVDDLVDAAESMAMLLRSERFETRTAYSGQDALQAAREFAPQVVLLDIGLPRLDGFEVARQLRAQPHMRGAAIVAVSGHSQPADRERALQAGIDRYLLKPVELDELLAVLAELFPR